MSKRLTRNLEEHSVNEQQNYSSAAFALILFVN